MLMGQFFYLRYLGTDAVTKTDEFSEKFETAIDPPNPSFSVNLVANFYQFHAQKALLKGPQSAS